MTGDHPVIILDNGDDRTTRRPYKSTLRVAHRTSGLVLLTFAVLHMANHLVGLQGQADHIAFMAAIRPVYRNPVVEPILLTLITVQVLSGITLVIRGWRGRTGIVAWLQAISGLYLSAFLLNHVASILYGRIALALDTDFRFAAAGFHVAGFYWFFAPYYLLAITALFTHLGCAAYWLTYARSQRLGVGLLAAFCSLGVVFGAFVIAALSGLLYAVDIPTAYLRTYQ